MRIAFLFQAMEALETLTSYQSGEDGLAKTLKTNQELQHKLNSRDKQIRALIMELNASQEIAQENCVLRFHFIFLLSNSMLLQRNSKH